jgi:Tol biopolymer transport system component
MKADLWKKIDELFAAAQAQPAGERAGFLDRLCEGDQELRAELESLLNAATSDKSFLEHPPAAPSDRPALNPGDKLGAFEIVERIGRGGMGEVYRARDSRLKRDVAIKVLPPDFADDPGRLRRFEHEARAASALKHPNIVSVFDIGSTDGVSWMVTELVEGRSLREVLAKGTMPVRKAAEVGAQIADGLAAAHAAGLVHRDLKAENVMLAPGDLVKILDFGIAKRAVRDVGASTVTDTLTRTGEVVGTVTSMSPEQVEGKEVDHRSDIFSLGVLLYEMLSGKRPFTGDTHAAVMNAIVNADATDLPANVPEAIAAVVRRCLEKLPEHRFQSAADLGYALRLVIAAHPHTAGPQKSSRRALVATVAAALVLAAAGAAYWWLRPESHPTDLHSVPLVAWPGKMAYPSFSRDGDRVAFQWNGEKEDKFHIYIEQIGSGARPVQLTNGPDDGCPVWSPDDKYIAFTRAASSGRALMLVPSIGGLERKVADFPFTANPYAWTPDLKWLVTALRDSPRDPSSIWLVSASTGERRRLTTPAAGMSGDDFASISPDGRSLAFTREVTSYRVAPFVLPLSPDYRPEGQPRELTTQRYAGMAGTAWTADGREIVFSGNGSLFRVPASGRHSPARLPYVTNALTPTVSPTRSRLAYMRLTVSENLWRLDTRTGERNVLLGSKNGISNLPQYSPDGRKIAFQSNRSGEMGVWTCDADGLNCVQLTSFGNSQGGAPRWAPDSQWIAFDSRVEGRSQIYVMRADGGGQRRMTNDPADDITPSWSHDGRWIYFVSDRSGRMEIWKVPAEGGAAVQVTRAGGGPAFESADGEFLYYEKYVNQGLILGPLFRIPPGGGPEVQVLPRVASWASFAIAAKGIYFTPDEKTIQRLEFSSSKISTLATVEEEFLDAGLGASPDERFVVWPQVRQIIELMLVEGFR